MKIQVVPEVSVHAEPLPGSWATYRVWVERSGEVLPNEWVTEDPHAKMDEVAARLRVLCGVQKTHARHEAAGTLAAYVGTGLTSPFFWAVVIGALLAASMH